MINKSLRKYNTNNRKISLYNIYPKKSLIKNINSMKQDYKAPNLEEKLE